MIGNLKYQTVAT